MTQNQFTISQSNLDAMLILAGKKDIRYYLNGLHIEYAPQFTRVIATDGHKMGIWQAQAYENIGVGSLTIPRDTIESLPKKCFTLTFTQVNETQWEINTGAATIKFTPCESRFPDFRRVAHSLQTTGTSGAAAGFNLEYLNQFEKAGNLLAGSKVKVGSRVRIHYNGDSGAMVRLNGVENFAGVLMPLRDSVGSSGALFPVDLTSALPVATSATAAPDLTIVQNAA